VVEVQALTVPVGHAMTRRTAWGFDPARLNLLVAVLQRRARLPLGQRDVFLNCAGGVRLVEPGVDLAAALAVWGAETNAGWDPGTVAIGEVGLGGEVRRVRCLEARLAEAAALGIRRAVIPAGQEEQAPPSIECHPVSDLQGAARLLVALPGRPRPVRTMPRWMLEAPETVA
jgi:DNA repair protein RadA/Sms